MFWSLLLGPQDALSSWLPHCSTVHPRKNALPGCVRAFPANTGLPVVHGSHQGITVAIFDGARERGIPLGLRAALGGLLQPAEHRRFGGEPLAAHLAARQVATVKEIIDRVRRDGEKLRRHVDIQHLW